MLDMFCIIFNNFFLFFFFKLSFNFIDLLKWFLIDFLFLFVIISIFFIFEVIVFFIMYCRVGLLIIGNIFFGCVFVVGKNLVFKFVVGIIVFLILICIELFFIN